MSVSGRDPNLQGPSPIDILNVRVRHLEQGLRTIRDWKLPQAKDIDGIPCSYGWAYGSNGERDYMRRVATDALAGSPTLENPKTAVMRYLWDEAHGGHYSVSGPFEQCQESEVVALSDYEKLWDALLVCRMYLATMDADSEDLAMIDKIDVILRTTATSAGGK